MKHSIFLLIIIHLGITSCVSFNKMQVLNVEMMKPPVLTNTLTMDTIALFSRDMARMDTTTYTYFFRGEPMNDSTIHYMDNYYFCIDALAERLVSEGSFAKVINYRDTMNLSIRTTNADLYKQLFKELGADVLIFLDRYKLNDFQYKQGDFGTSEITGDFKEFIKSTYLANIWGSLQWTLRIKGDTTRYEFMQMDDLYYGDSMYPEFFGGKEQHQRMLNNTSIYFGKQFAEKLIPTWQMTDRTYYISRDSLMQKGAQYCRTGEWLKAAELYKRLIGNKNKNLSSRAAYNMALVCEMSGDMEAATDWLKRSEYLCQPDDTLHQNNCKEYLQLLNDHKKEIRLLDELMNKKATIQH